MTKRLEQNDLDKFYFDYDNIELDDYHHPLDPDDSSHSKILTVYCPKELSNDEIKSKIQGQIKKAEKLDKYENEDWIAVERKVWKLIIQENKELKEKLEKIQRWFDYCKGEMNVTIAVAYDCIVSETVEGEGNG